MFFIVYTSSMSKNAGINAFLLMVFAARQKDFLII